MKAKFFTLLLFVVLSLSLFVSFAAAEQFEVIKIPISYDYLVSTPSPSDTVCTCSSASFPVTVTNIGSYTTIFTLSVNDPKADISQPKLTLQPGEHRQVMVSRSASCFESGSKELIVSVKSSFHFTKEVKKTLTFGDCSSVAFAFDKVNLEEEICKSFTTTLFITNTGSVKETYYITPLEGSVTLSAGSATVFPGQTAQIIASYDLACDVHGEFTLDYEVSTKSTGNSYRVSQNLLIPYAYDFDVRVAPELNFCAQDTAKFIVELENKNNFSNDFKLDFDLPKFASIELDGVSEKDPVISVPANTVVPVTISFSPSQSDVGRDVVELEVTDKFGGLVKTNEFNLSVANCYDLSTAYWTPKKKYVCGYDFIELPFSLFNNGDRDGAISLEVNGSEYVYFQESSYDIAAHSALEVPLVIDVSDNAWGEYPITIISRSGDKVLNSHSFTLFTQTQEFCYAIKPKKNSLDVTFDDEAFIVPVKHTGTRDASYLATLSGDTESLGLLTSEISLEPRKSSWFVVNVSEVQEVGTVKNISLNMFDLDSGLAFSYPLTVEFTDYSFFKKAYLYVYDTIYYTDNCVLLSFALALVILILLLIIICRKYARRSYKTPKAILLVFILLLVIFAGVVYFTNGIPFIYTSYDLETNSTTHMLLEEDTPLVLDLSEYFFDPDNDIVEYGVSSINTDMLSFEVDNESLTLYPALDITGQTMIMLYATDAYGATAESRQIRVDILPVEDYSCSELYMILCSYVNWLLLLIVAILFFFVAAYPKTKQTYQRTLNEVIVVRSESKQNKEVEAPKAPKKEAKKKVSSKKSTKSVSKK